MQPDTLLALFLFAFTTSITPGPNNMMLFASGVNFGFVRTIPHMLGIGTGFFVLLIAVGLGLGALLHSVPLLYTALKIAGGANGSRSRRGSNGSTSPWRCCSSSVSGRC